MSAQGQTDSELETQDRQDCIFHRPLHREEIIYHAALPQNKDYLTNGQYLPFALYKNYPRRALHPLHLKAFYTDVNLKILRLLLQESSYLNSRS